MLRQGADFISCRDGFTVEPFAHGLRRNRRTHIAPVERARHVGGAGNADTGIVEQARQPDYFGGTNHPVEPQAFCSTRAINFVRARFSVQPKVVPLTQLSNDVDTLRAVEIALSVSLPPR